jgi:hypothetical protein
LWCTDEKSRLLLLLSRGSRRRRATTTERGIHRRLCFMMMMSNSRRSIRPSVCLCVCVSSKREREERESASNFYELERKFFRFFPRRKTDEYEDAIPSTINFLQRALFIATTFGT